MGKIILQVVFYSGSIERRFNTTQEAMQYLQVLKEQGFSTNHYSIEVEREGE